MKTYSSVPGIKEKVKEILCPVCGNKIYNHLWDLETFKYSKCNSCNLIYQNPQPLSSDVEERYDNDYFNYEIENEGSFLNLMLLGLKDIGFVPKTITAGSKKVLDIGCATGLFLSHMKGLGWDTYGVEICKDAAEYGNSVRGVNIHNGLLETAGYEDNSFDIIHLSHVIEHVNEPFEFLNNIYKLLKSGGVLYCTTPNVDGFQAKLFKEKWRSAIADHLVLFSKATLSMLLKKAGFKNLKCKTWGGLCAGSGFPNFVKKILDKLCKPLGFGDVMIFRGYKK